ncbi:MAG TPA: LuxR C-terminal-related transcriptional regulator [Fimbriimonadaceae bacterium]|nr:LuxR C-terminal-related transcriptional regulator [Fimbriimonadaceae bacterium]
MPDFFADTGLSERERDVLLLAAEGLTDKEIAQRLNIAVKTVTTYWDRMRLKFGATNKTQVLATALRSAYEDVVTNEERLRAFVQHMPVLFCAFNEEGALRLFNREWEQATGYTEQEIASPDFIARLIPDDLERERALELWTSGTSDYRDLEIDIVTREGACKKIAWSSAAAEFPIHGWAHWSIGIDVTARAEAEEILKQSREQYRQLLRDCEEGEWLVNLDQFVSFLADACVRPIVKFDTEHRCVYANIAFQGLAEQRALTGVSLTELSDMLEPQLEWEQALQTAIGERVPTSFQGAIGSLRTTIHVFPQPTPTLHARFALAVAELSV